MCTLVLILWGHAFDVGLFKDCFYDCGQKKYGHFDRVYRAAPNYVCPARFYEI